MFEHLGPVPETTQKKRLFSRGYMVFLLFALMVYTVLDSSTSGPAVEASYQENETRAFVYSTKKQNDIMVNHSHGTVFDFFIEAASPNTSLNSIRLKINGSYDPSILTALRLYQDSVQLGAGAKIENGYLYFDIANYKLPEIKNYFYLLLPDGDLTDVDDEFYFSIEDRSDLFLSYNGYNFSADGIYPISGKEISIVENGRLIFVNKNNNERFYHLTNERQGLSTFTLSSDIERAYLYKIILDYKFDKDDYLSDSIFTLEQNGSLMTEAIVDTDNNKIIFELEKFLAIKNNKTQDFSIKVDSLAEGIYDFDMDIVAIGYLSGKDIGVKNINLDKIIVRENYPIFEQLPLDNKIKEGWNKLYAINMKSAKEGNVSLNKLSWKIDSINIDIKDIRLVLDGKRQDIGLNFREDELSVIWLPELILDDGGQVLELLVNLEDINEISSINAYLLADSSDSDNNIWSYRDLEHNSYLLPHLPLAPQFLR